MSQEALSPELELALRYASIAEASHRSPDGRRSSFAAGEAARAASAALCAAPQPERFLHQNRDESPQPQQQSEVETRLRVIHFNDCYDLKHLPRLKTLIDSARAGHRNAITTMAGDFLAPSLLSSLDHGAGMVDIFNKLPVDFVCVGNHESDVPFEALLERIGQSRFTWLNSNMPALANTFAFAARELEAEDGTPAAREVGFTGLLEADPTLYRSGAFGGAVESLVPVLEHHSAAAAALRAAHPRVDCVLPLTHQGQADDEALASSGARARPDPPPRPPLSPASPLLHLRGPSPPRRRLPGGAGGARPRDQPGGGARRPRAQGAAQRRTMPRCDTAASSSTMSRLRFSLQAGMDATHAIVLDLRWRRGAPRGAPPEVSHSLLPTADFAPDVTVAAAAERAMAPVRELQAATLTLLPVTRRRPPPAPCERPCTRAPGRGHARAALSLAQQRPCSWLFTHLPNMAGARCAAAGRRRGAARALQRGRAPRRLLDGHVPRPCLVMRSTCRAWTLLIWQVPRHRAARLCGRRGGAAQLGRGARRRRLCDARGHRRGRRGRRLPRRRRRRWRRRLVR